MANFPESVSDIVDCGRSLEEEVGDRLSYGRRNEEWEMIFIQRADTAARIKGGLVAGLRSGELAGQTRPHAGSG